jgi:hypothetical protein
MIFSNRISVDAFFPAFPAFSSKAPLAAGLEARYVNQLRLPGAAP